MPDPAWHRRARRQRLAAVDLLRSAASVLRAGADLPRQLRDRLQSAASLAEHHHGSAVPQVVADYLTANMPIDVQLGKGGKGKGSKGQAGKGDENKDKPDMVADPAGVWNSHQHKNKPLADSAGQRPTRGASGRLFVLCGRGQCSSWFYLSRLSSTVCSCNNRWPQHVLEQAVELGAPVPGMGTVRIGSIDTKGNGKGGAQQWKGSKGKAQGRGGDETWTAKGRGGKGARQPKGGGKGQGKRDDAAGASRRVTLQDDTVPSTGRPVPWLDRKGNPLAAPPPTANSVDMLADDQLEQLIAEARKAGRLRGGDDLEFVAAETEDLPMLEDAEHDGQATAPADDGHAQQKSHRQLYETFRKLDNRVHTARKRWQKLSETHDAKRVEITKLEQKLQQERDKAAEMHEKIRGKLEHLQELELDADKARDEYRAATGLEASAAKDRVKEAMPADVAASAWDQLAEDVVADVTKQADVELDIVLDDAKAAKLKSLIIAGVRRTRAFQRELQNPRPQPAQDTHFTPWDMDIPDDDDEMSASAHSTDDEKETGRAARAAKRTQERLAAKKQFARDNHQEVSKGHLKLKHVIKREIAEAVHATPTAPRDDQQSS